VRSQVNPFLSSEWLRVWEGSWGQGRPLVTFAEGDELLSLVPLCQVPAVYANGGLRRTSFYETANATAFIKRIKASLRSGVVVFFDVPDTGELAAGLRRFGARSTLLYPTPLIRFGSDPRPYIERQFSGKRRKELRRHYDRLKELGTIQFRCYRSRDDVSVALSLFDRFCFCLAERYDEQKRESNAYISPLGKVFLWNLLEQMLGNGVEFTVVTLDGVPISFAVCYRVGNRLIYAIPAMDSAFGKLGLGHIHLMKLIELSQADGVEVVDLSKGEADYKRKWANSIESLSLFVLPVSQRWRDRVLARLIVACFSVRPWARQAGLLQLIRRFRSSLSSGTRGTAEANCSLSQEHAAFSYPLIANAPLVQRATMVDRAFKATSVGNDRVSAR